MLRKILQTTWKPRYYLSGIHYDLLYSAKKKLVKLKDIYENRPMLVVGNGPSLNKTPLDEFKNIPSIGMNKIDLLYDRVTWRPSLVVSVNTIVARQHYIDFSKSEIPIWLAYKSRLAIPREYRDRLCYFKIMPSYKFSSDLTLGVGAGETVTYAALQFAWYMGANPVILFGVDHSFTTTHKNKLKYEKRSGDDVNHFHPDYFKAGSLWGVPDLEESEKLYLFAKQHFELHGRKIYDATVDGKLNVFEKINIDTAKKIVDI